MNLAHGEFIAIGAYTAYACQARGWPYLTAIPAACLVCGALALLVERVLIRPLYQRPFDTMLATWGLSLLLRKTVELSTEAATEPGRAPVGLGLGAGRSVSCCVLLIVLARRHHRACVVPAQPDGARIKAMVGNPELAGGGSSRRAAGEEHVRGRHVPGRAGWRDGRAADAGAAVHGLDHPRAFFVLVVGARQRGGPGERAGLIGGVESAMSAIVDRTWGYSTVLLIAIVFLWLRPRGIFARV